MLLSLLSLPANGYFNFENGLIKKGSGQLQNFMINWFSNQPVKFFDQKNSQVCVKISKMLESQENLCCELILKVNCIISLLYNILFCASTNLESLHIFPKEVFNLSSSLTKKFSSLFQYFQNA